MNIIFYIKIVFSIVDHSLFFTNGLIDLDSEIKHVGEGKDIGVFFKVTNEEAPVLDITIVYEDIEVDTYRRRIFVEGRKKLFESNNIMVTA